MCLCVLTCWSQQCAYSISSVLLDFPSCFLKKYLFRISDLCVFFFSEFFLFVPSLNCSHQTKFRSEVGNVEEGFCICKLGEKFPSPPEKEEKERKEMMPRGRVPLSMVYSCTVLQVLGKTYFQAEDTR